ncbi:YraN family protein [Corynebacterium suicordis]|uniref:UPF0102 protein IRY30_04810 n=1 Tax=Corynebacterium suicordis DSM 45110 TaxID=1121369 RepID=A0ABR9ZIZ3_9CORY|nr:YraN family protein [Corynebacterium suicordis]MBF4553401.1 YraN family protein [Corynebacterium suicordis DSM 45110]MDR6277624.1 putative endonuclease [Corynebacterium suicordis]
MTTKAMGDAGEDCAVRYLSEMGWQVLERNWECRVGELDIVALSAGVLVFVEVKYRTRTRFGSGAEAITPAKIRRVTATALQWMESHRRELQARGANSSPLRFDVIDVGPAGVRQHIQGAW